MVLNAQSLPAELDHPCVIFKQNGYIQYEIDQVVFQLGKGKWAIKEEKGEVDVALSWGYLSKARF